MARLLDILGQSVGTHALCNDYDITVQTAEGERADGTVYDGWFVQARDYLTDNGRRDNRILVVNHRLEFWDEVTCILSELGVPDDYEGWVG